MTLPRTFQSMELNHVVTENTFGNSSQAGAGGIAG